MTKYPTSEELNRLSPQHNEILQYAINDISSAISCGGRNPSAAYMLLADATILINNIINGMKMTDRNGERLTDIAHF